MEACSVLYPYIKKSLDVYYVNKEPMTLYELMKLYAKFKPNGVQRYKGLGEMSSKEIKESMIDPNGARTLLRLNVDDVKKAINDLREVQSDLSSLIKDVDMSISNGVKTAWAYCYFHYFTSKSRTDFI